jgi:hypothetical protein
MLFAVRIHEPQSHGTQEIVTLLVGVTPFRIIRFPVGLYRAYRNGTQRVGTERLDQQRPKKRVA